MLATSAASAQAPADTNVAPRAASSALPQIAARRQYLLAQMLADPGNLDIAFEYAALSSQVGDLEGAISTLERMLIFAPGLPRLHLELGVLYYRLGAYESASSYFEAALAAPDVPQDVRDSVAPYMAAIGKHTETSGFEGAILVGTRYQTNATGAPDSDIVHLGDFEFVLSDGSTSQPDFNAFVSGNFHYSYDLASQGDRLVASLLTYGALYKEHGELNTGVVELKVGPSFNLQRFEIDDGTFDVYAIAGAAIIEGNPYLAAGGVGASVWKGLGPNARLGLEAEYRREAYFDSDSRPTASDRTGNKFTGAATLQYQINEMFGIFGELNGQRRDTEVDYLSFWEAGVTVGAKLDFASPFEQQTDLWTLAVTAGYLHRIFDEPDLLFSLTDAEVDDEAFVQGTLSVPVLEGWSVQTTAGYRVVISNYDLSNAENIHGSLGVMKKF